MQQYLFSKFCLPLRDNNDYCRYFQSRMTETKFRAFGFGILIALFIIYYLLFHETQVKPTIIFMNKNTSSERKTSHMYSFVINGKLVPSFISKIFDKAQLPATCLVVIRTTDGGIGNRMFLFASAYGLARLHQCDLYVGPWIVKDLRSIFTIHLNETPVHLVTNDSVANETGIYGRYSACTLFDDLLKVPLDPNLTRYEMIGFYQAFGYFLKYKEEISYLFQFNQFSIKNNVPLVEQLLKVVWNIPLNLGNYTKDNVTHQYLKSLLTRPPAPLIPVTWIGIHIRRGDFLTFFKIDTTSDDKDYAKTNLGNLSDIFITPNSFFSGDDLAALTLCEHTIVTAGSYGWWAGWLAGGNVVHDLNYPVAKQKCLREHYFPPWFLFPHNSSSQQPPSMRPSNQ
ncbi:unnamed protein product [Rotaria socialis]|uniref:L-Fucosyltransferase n=2 Tax=Rotaria socialis TaxID=392032 RepID=A0A817K9P0_9BILA|nr:unnamed protein product [Rotaria socialis]